MASEANAAPHTGLVIAVSDGQAVLRFERGKMCKRCGACLAVGAREMEMTLNNTLGVAVGDRVSVQLSGAQVAGASLIAYGIPLLLLLAGILLGSLVSDFAALAGGIGGCVVSALLLRLLDRRLRRRKTLQPVMRAILPPDQCPDGEPEREPPS